MSLAEQTRPEAPTGPPHRRVSSIVGLVAAVLVGAFVLTSALISTLPQFRFESQFPALLPFFAWAAAAGVGHLSNLGRTLLAPWRAAYGYASIAPYLLLMLTSAAAPHLTLPWWLAPIAAVAAMVPFLLLVRRAGTRLSIDPVKDANDASLRGTFTIGIALMLLVWAVSGPAFSGAVIAVLLAVGLGIASMATHGIARASRTWRLRHWASLALGSLVVWASVLVRATTHVFDSVWVAIAAVLLAGLPLIVVNSIEARRR